MGHIGCGTSDIDASNLEPRTYLHLFISDIHFGRSDRETERLVERDLLSLLRSARPEVEALFLVGDIFEYFIEYRHSIPKGFARFMGLLAEWTDAGIPVHYFVGNHDLWHRDYFETELGVRVIGHDSVERLGDLRVYITHGDGIRLRASPCARLKPILRHPLPVAIYTGLLPSDWGLGIARWYSRRFGKTTVNPRRVDELREAARQLLGAKNTDVIVMGHSHHPEITYWKEGTYVNSGSWYQHRTVAIIKDGETSIMKWNGTALLPYSQD